ncbi:MAG: sulfatase-like hydrolase/transferase, partial [Planctomycetota bacterium]
MKIVQRRLAGAAAVAICLILIGGKACEAAKPNVLFLAVDDLRSQLGCYGDEQMVTPNIDALAARGVLFQNHYVANPICIPSRAALLTSLRSERTRQVYGPSRWTKVSGVQTIGSTFSDAGYFTASLGKIWHTKGDVPAELEDRFDVAWKRTSDAIYADPEFSKIREQLDYGKRKDTQALKAKLPACEGPFDVDDEAYGDGQMTQEAIKLLRQASGQAEPFMFMVGFQKPHLPFNAPKKYWDLYDPESPPGEPELETLPKHGSRLQIRRNHELWRYREGFSLREPPAGAAAA